MVRRLVGYWLFQPTLGPSRALKGKRCYQILALNRSPVLKLLINRLAARVGRNSRKQAQDTNLVVAEKSEILFASRSPILFW